MKTAERIVAESNMIQVASGAGQQYPLNEIYDHIRQAASDKSFIFISGPSWSGKTQLIYALDRLSSYPMKVHEKTSTPSLDAKFYCVLHLVMEQDTSQIIYQAQNDVSKALLAAVRTDFDGIRPFLADMVESGDNRLSTFCKDLGIDGQWFPSVKTASRKQILECIEKIFTDLVILSTKFIEYFGKMFMWRSLGILDELIDMRVNRKALDETIPLKPVSPVYVDEFYKKHLASRELPVVACLDEFNLTSLKSKTELIFLRNLLRSISNLTPILLGTNAKAANLVDEYSVNTTVSRDDEHPWCRLFYRLPSANFESVGFQSLYASTFVDDKIVKWLRVACGRPGILKLFIANFEPQDLVGSFVTTFTRILRRKALMSSPLSIEGYYEMIFSRFRANHVIEHACSAELINRHLAHLIPNNFTHIESLPVVQPLFKSKITHGLYLFADKIPWDKDLFDPHSLYLYLQTDELTQMILFSDWTKQFGSLDRNLANIFLEVKRASSIEKAKQEIIRLVRTTPNLNVLTFSFRLIVECLHNNQSDNVKSGVGVRSGNKLENLINGCFVKAAASGGPYGSPLEAFLTRFASEMSLEKLFDVKWDAQSLVLLGPIKDQLVPYVIAVNHRVTPEFRSLDGIYTGFYPEFSNVRQLDGRCIPDWVTTIKAPTSSVSGHSALPFPVLRNAQALSENSKCQLYITLEMKNHTVNVGAGVVAAVLRRAALNGRKIGLDWPRSSGHPVHHLHLLCVSSLAAVKDWDQIRSHCSHLMRVLKLTYDKEANIIGLRDMFGEGGGASANTTTTVEGSVGEAIVGDGMDIDGPAETLSAGNPSGRVTPAAVAEVIVGNEPATDVASSFANLGINASPGEAQAAPTEAKQNNGMASDDIADDEASTKVFNLRQIAKEPAATASFLPTTVIIVALKDLFEYGFESASNLTAKPPTNQIKRGPSDHEEEASS